MKDYKRIILASDHFNVQNTAGTDLVFNIQTDFKQDQKYLVTSRFIMFPYVRSDHQINDKCFNEPVPNLTRSRVSFPITAAKIANPGPDMTLPIPFTKPFAISLPVFSSSRPFKPSTMLSKVFLMLSKHFLTHVFGDDWVVSIFNVEQK